MPASLVQTIIRALTQLIGARQVRAVVCVALMVSANAATAQAPNQHFGAETIFRGCKVLVEGKAPNEALFSLGNLCAGIVLGIASVGQHLSPPEWQFCPPATASAQQLAQVAVNYREAHPQQAQEDFTKVILEAFHDAWPCPR